MVIRKRKYGRDENYQLLMVQVNGGHIYKQTGVIFLMNNGTDPKWRALKIIEGLRGKDMEYFDTLPVEVGKDWELLCK